MSAPVANERRGDWMMTWSGRQFWPLDPRPGDVDIDDIAHALGHQGRYNGHTRHFYSVAQHSVLLAEWFVKQGKPDLARQALLHDAAEAYVGDVIRPLKRDLPGFALIESLVEQAILKRFELPPIALAVKDADGRIVIDEMIALFPYAALAETGISQRANLGLRIVAWTPPTAVDRFLEMYRQLWGRA